MSAPRTPASAPSNHQESRKAGHGSEEPNLHVGCLLMPKGEYVAGFTGSASRSKNRLRLHTLFPLVSDL